MGRNSVMTKMRQFELKDIKCEICLNNIKPHLRVLLEDDVDLDALIADMHSSCPGGSNEYINSSSGHQGSDLSPNDASSRDHLWERSSSEHEGSPEDTKNLNNMAYSSDDEKETSMPIEIRSHHGRQGRLPKSMSLPLSKNVPDPFPELACTPSSTPLGSVGSLVEKNTSKSSPSSPLFHRLCSPKSPKKPALDHANSYSLIYSNLHALSKTDLPLEYASPPLPKSRLTRSSSTLAKTMLNFHNDDRNHKSVSVDDTMPASSVCYLLILKNQVREDKSWAVQEHIEKFQLERTIEDHEQVLPIYRSWLLAENNKFYFKKDFRKYELFTDPSQFFPQSMMDLQGQKFEDVPVLTTRSEVQRNLVLQNLFSTCDSLPDMQGYLQMRDSNKKSWKKHFFILRKSGLYYSSKGSSKDPRYLVLVSHLNEVNIYIANNAKKTLGAPNNFCFVLKPPHCVNDVKDLKCFCAEDDQARAGWVMGLRLVKYESQLYTNFKAASKRECKLQSIENQEAMYAARQGIYVKARVAVDCTGSKPRVVSDPNEALNIAAEEAKHWRKKVSNSTHSPNHSPQRWSMMPNHIAQPWFHHRISREEAVNLMMEHGAVDGTFLVRESNSNPGTYVLTLSHNFKVRHCQIRKFDVDGEIFLSLDMGKTKFQDLLQLVDFYQLNQGGLPTRLNHYISRPA